MDNSGCEAPLTADGWTREVDDRFLFSLVNAYLEKAPDASYRQLIDYFEHRHGYLLDRNEVGHIIEDMAVTGQLSRAPSDWMVPSELQDLAATVNRWLRKES